MFQGRSWAFLEFARKNTGQDFCPQFSLDKIFPVQVLPPVQCCFKTEHLSLHDKVGVGEREKEPEQEMVDGVGERVGLGLPLGVGGDGERVPGHVPEDVAEALHETEPVQLIVREGDTVAGFFSPTGGTGMPCTMGCLPIVGTPPQGVTFGPRCLPTRPIFPCEWPIFRCVFTLPTQKPDPLGFENAPPSIPPPQGAKFPKKKPARWMCQTRRRSGKGTGWRSWCASGCGWWRG